jgi:hypothetical protein
MASRIEQRGADWFLVDGNGWSRPASLFEVEFCRERDALKGELADALIAFQGTAARYERAADERDALRATVAEESTNFEDALMERDAARAERDALERKGADAMHLLAAIVQQAGGELTVQSSAFMALGPRWKLRRDDDLEQRWIRFRLEVQAQEE